MLYLQVTCNYKLLPYALKRCLSSQITADGRKSSLNGEDRLGAVTECPWRGGRMPAARGYLGLLWRLQNLAAGVA